VINNLADCDIIVIKANGKREAFDVEKLRASLINSGAEDAVVEDVIDHVAPELRDGMSTSEIYKHAFSVLAQMNKKVAHSYSLRRAVMDLGPSGFPFEKFIAEVLKSKGYETVTDQIVLGGCVPHEVDVVAWNEKKLIMCEAKFHNELGTKSDLKVVLYVKARFDDLKDNVYNYGGGNRKLDEGWLITNTKFSSTAIHYGVCQNLVMIGWNYPENGNLQEMIEEGKLHPVTCLESLTQSEKGALLREGLVLASHILDKPGELARILGDHVDTEKVLEEIKLL
jgi:hypothetical protein